MAESAQHCQQQAPEQKGQLDKSGGTGLHFCLAAPFALAWQGFVRKGSSMKKILSLPLRQIIGDEAVHNVQHEVKNGKHRLVSSSTKSSTDWVELHQSVYWAGLVGLCIDADPEQAVLVSALDFALLSASSAVVTCAALSCSCVPIQVEGVGTPAGMSWQEQALSISAELSKCYQYPLAWYVIEGDDTPVSLQGNGAILCVKHGRNKFYLAEQVAGPFTTYIAYNAWYALSTHPSLLATMVEMQRHFSTKLRRAGVKESK